MTNKRFRVNTEDIGHIYIDNPDGEHMSWIEVEETLNGLASDCSRLEKENEKLKEIFMEQLENALTLSFVKEVYCNALLRILDENSSVEESKKFIKDYLNGDCE